MFKLKLGASSASMCNGGARGVGDKRKVPTRESDSNKKSLKKVQKCNESEILFTLDLRSGSKSTTRRGGASLALAGRGPGAILAKK